MRSVMDAQPEERLKQLLLESTGEGVYGVDVHGRCTFVNRAATELLGYPTEQLLGRNMHRLIHHSRSDGACYPEDDCPIFNAFRSGVACRVDDEVLWRADGTAFDAEYSSHPILDRGEVRGAVVTFLDITERKRAEAQLVRAHAELESRVAERTAELSGALGQLRDLSAHLETVREEERTRIARDIHDELGSLLVALKMDVHWLAGRVSHEVALQSKCRAMAQLIDRAVDNVGRIVTDLRPSLLDYQGLWAALEWQALEFIAATGLSGTVRVHVCAGTQIPAGVAGERWAIAVFRIFQEILNNVARHANARSLTVGAYVDGPPAAALYLDVKDDGIGGATRSPTAAARAVPHFGVIGMRERAARFGGKLDIHSPPGGGTRVRLVMPFPEPPT